MQIRRNTLFVCLLLAASACFGQQTETPLTSVALFKVTPDKIAAFMDVMKLFTPELDKLLAAGTIRGYGVDSDIVHTGEPNVAFWISSSNFTTLAESEKAVQSVIRGNPDKMKTAWGLSDFAAHRDLIVRSVESNYGRVPEGALPVSDFDARKIKPGKSSSVLMMFRHFDKPILDKLVADGVIYGYSLDVEAVHTMEPGMSWFITVLPSLGAKDKVRAAYNAAFEKLSASERDAMQKMEDDMFVPGSHRDSLSEALIFRTK